MKTFTHSKSNKIYKKNIIFAKVIKRSVTYTVKSFVYQCFVHGRGHFTKRLKKKAVQDHERKPLNVNTLHFLFDFVQLSEYDLYLFK